MKKVYIVDEYLSSQMNGIGRYIREMTNAFSNILKIDTAIIELNSPSKDFNIKDVENVRRFCIPQASNYFKYDSFVICCLIKPYIKDSEENIFLVNHSPCKTLITSIREYFPLSKIMFVIHDLSWTSPLLGNKELFEVIMRNRDREYVKEKYEAELKAIDIVKQLLSSVDCTICLSQSTTRLVNKYYDVPKEKICYIPNFLSDRRIVISRKMINKKKKQYNIQNDKIIINIGRTTIPKGVLSLVRSFKTVSKKYPNTRLVLIGPVVDPDKILTECKTILPRITFAGHIPFDELLEWYQMADIGVISSYTEQCSYAGIEMLMSGLPIVASDGFGVNEMFQKNINATIAKIEDYVDSTKYERNLANAIIKIIKSVSLQERLRIESRKTYEETYSLKQAELNLHKIFHKY